MDGIRLLRREELVRFRDLDRGRRSHRGEQFFDPRIPDAVPHPHGVNIRWNVAEPLEHLNETETDCVRRFVALLVERLQDNLAEIVLFGYAARGDMWSDNFPIRSDIDLLVLTREPLAPALQEELINETYPLYLECGRQIGPQWRTVDEWSKPKDEPTANFRAVVETEGRAVYPRSL